jgi:hypothetical protein
MPNVMKPECFLPLFVTHFRRPTVAPGDGAARRHVAVRAAIHRRAVLAGKPSRVLGPPSDGRVPNLQSVLAGNVDTHS